MKIFIILLLIYGLVFQPTLNVNVWDKWSQECASETNLSIYPINIISRKLEHKLAVSKPFKCYDRCMAVKSGFITADGEPNIAMMNKLFLYDDEKLLDFAKCTLSTTDQCERYFDLYKCIMQIQASYNDKSKRRSYD